MSGKAGQHGQHEAPGSRLGIELLGHTAHANPVLFELGYRIQYQPCLPAKAIQLEDEKLIESAFPGVLQKATAVRAQLQRYGARNAVISVGFVDGQSVQLAVARGE